MWRTAPIRISCCCLLVTLSMAGSMAHADDRNSDISPALDRFSLWLGGYEARTNTTINAGLNNSNINGRVDLQHDLGFPTRQTVPRVRLDVLLGKHQGFSFDYYRIDQTRTRTLDRTIGFNGDTFNAAASVTGRVNFDFGSTVYRWWFGSGSDVFGIGVGAAYYRVYAGISGQASLNGQVMGDASASTSASAWAPQLQLGWKHAFSDSLRMYFQASGVKGSGNRLGGHIYDAALGVEWFPWKNIGLAAEYDYTRIHFHQEHRTYNDDFTVRMNGPSLFLRVRF